MLPPSPPPRPLPPPPKSALRGQSLTVAAASTAKKATRRISFSPLPQIRVFESVLNPTTTPRTAKLEMMKLRRLSGQSLDGGSSGAMAMMNEEEDEDMRSRGERSSYADLEVERLDFDAAASLDDSESGNGPPSSREKRSKRRTSLSELPSRKRQRLEPLEMSGSDSSSLQTPMRQMVVGVVVADSEVSKLRKEIEMLGFPSEKDGEPYSIDELSERIELARTMRRRAEIRLALARATSLSGEERTPPVELPRAVLIRKLHERRISWKSLDHFGLISAVEIALLKESDGLIGDGYEFGRKYVRVLDLIEHECFSDKDLRVLLQERKVPAIPRKKEEKINLLTDLIQKNIEDALMIGVRRELELEVKRRNLRVLHPEEPQTTTALFDLVYSSHVWKNDFEPWSEEQQTAIRLALENEDLQKVPASDAQWWVITQTVSLVKRFLLIGGGESV